MSLQYIRNIKIKNVRGFAAAAAAKPKPDTSSSPTSQFVPREDIKTTVVNNVVVSSVENNKPLARVSVFYKAGSRYENTENQGVVHALRCAFGLAAGETSKFGLTRTVEQIGGNLHCTAGREHVSYTLESTRDKVEGLQDIIRDYTSRQQFKRWEVSDNLPRLKYDLFSVSPEVLTLEKLHKVIFRRGLGNSLYMPKCMLGKHTSKMLTEYVSDNFVEASVVGVGVPHELCERLAKRLRLKPSEKKRTEPTITYAGEIRKDVGGDLAYVALGFAGAGFTNGKEMVASALASRALGTGARIKRGNLAGAKLSTAQIEGSHSSAFSTNYSDNGILGVFIVALPNVISSATKRSAEVLRGASFTEEDITRAKNILKADLSFALESEDEIAEDMGLQSLFNGQVHSYTQIVQLIDSVSASDVNKLMKKGVGKLSMSAFGNIGHVPYLDELN